MSGSHAVLEDLEGDYKGKMPFYEVDVEEEAALFEKMMMKGVPQVVIFVNGDPVENWLAIMKKTTTSMQSKNIFKSFPAQPV